MGEVQWIKLKVGMFDDSKIKYIEALPERDTIITIWVKLLTLAGKYNEQGYIMLSENLPYNAEMLANEFNRPLNSVRLAIQTFQKLGMVEDVGALRITNWKKHQNVEGLEKIRQQTRERVRKHREQNKLNNSNVTVTQGNATEEEIELDKELELEEEVNTLSGNPTTHQPHYQPIINYLNEKTGKHYKHTTNKTQTVIKARWNEGFTEDDFRKVIDNKVAEWKGTDMEKFLRPETLFGNKFEGYLNQQVSNKESDDNPYANLF
ncbi:phage replisome organizer N-terminal domain-containing protein [Staphylococcus saprophyticus]|uniref:phage replisome organizer N-terminal domain-containing protein n=1 Tax=Staphylococcus saprophyticus TaxID=29385 RepID=UPI0009907AAE|nr:phage replisome organizer N-terminal domain-containing protein [Staphylococcus saprophyticus]OOO72404.1 replication protein [Staphylococcus saprophyticus]